MKKLMNNLSAVTVFFLVLMAISSALPAAFSLEDAELSGKVTDKTPLSLATAGESAPSSADGSKQESDLPVINYSVKSTQTEELIPHSTIRIPTNTLPYGVEKTAKRGQDGLIIHRYEVITYPDGKSEEHFISSEKIREAADEVIYYGNCLSTPFNEFIYPTQGHLTSDYGYRTLNGVRAFHYGIDIANCEGTPIVASDSGVVIFAGTDRSYGNYVLIDHQNGFVTCYAHLKSICVSEGQSVARSTQIGFMGQTGYATGNHLHFEIRLDGVRVDPEKYLSGELTQKQKGE